MNINDLTWYQRFQRTISIIRCHHLVEKAKAFQMITYVRIERVTNIGARYACSSSMLQVYLICLIGKAMWVLLPQLNVHLEKRSTPLRYSASDVTNSYKEKFFVLIIIYQKKTHILLLHETSTNSTRNHTLNTLCELEYIC